MVEDLPEAGIAVPIPPCFPLLFTHQQGSAEVSSFLPGSLSGKLRGVMARL